MNIASLLSFQGGVLIPACAAAKAGVAQLTKGLANEWAPKGINVNAIAPGYMATDNRTVLRKDRERSRQILEASLPAGGVSLRIWVVLSSFVRWPVIMSTATSSWWTSAGWRVQVDQWD